MKCNHELISALIDDELDDVILEAVVKHAMECDECCKVVSELVQVRDLISSLYLLRKPESLVESIMSAIQKERILPISKGSYNRNNSCNISNSIIIKRSPHPVPRPTKPKP